MYRIAKLMLPALMLGLASSGLANPAEAEESKQLPTNAETDLKAEVPGKLVFAVVFDEAGKAYMFHATGVKATTHSTPPFVGKKVLGVEPFALVHYEGSHCYSYYKNGSWQEYCPQH